MKATSIIIALVWFGQSLLGQNRELPIFSAQETSGNSAENPCISESQYRMIEERCRRNVQTLHLTAQSRNALLTGLNWPLKPSASLTDCSYFYISAHVDHNATASAFQDYNCGTLTYDGHTGTDIAIGPFGFYKMDNNQVEVTAAAAGTIIDKHDGEYDRNCVGSGSGLVANYIIIQHADGSRALYWHMKKNAVTSKAIGQTVAAGEYLGIVGSSGSSSGPHLHFEIWSGSTQATKIDPFAGTCNLINSVSWWNVQKPYREPAILKASVHTTDVVLPGCPTTETPNESTTYTIPFQGPGLPAGYAKFYLFMRNAVSGTVATMQILNPDNTVFNTWNYTFTSNLTSGYYGFSKVLPVNPGVYTFKATYNGNSCLQQFTIVNPLALEDLENDGTLIFPNPARDQLTIHLNKVVNGKIDFYNDLGQNVRTMTFAGQDLEIPRNGLLQGIYFLVLTQNDKVMLTKKIIFVDF